MPSTETNGLEGLAHFVNDRSFSAEKEKWFEAASDKLR